MAPTTATINGIEVCRNCWGEGTQAIPGMMDNELCEDCKGTGFDSDIPEAIALDEVPEHVEMFLIQPAPADPLDAIVMLKDIEERVVFAPWSDKDAAYRGGDHKRIKRIREYLESQRRVA